MKQRIHLVIMTVILLVSLAYSIVEIYFYEDTPLNFTCRSKVYVLDESEYSSCARKSSADFFLSINENGTGYMVVSGSSICIGEKDITTLTDIINFNYTKEADFYSFTLGKRKLGVSRISQLLKDDVIKLKISRVNSNDYIITTPISPIMMCTTDKD